ncbi:MAG TPA: YfbU family protein [Stellaceae bacterium]|nr:YfbU family protein [Stellaceae bacterium]
MKLSKIDRIILANQYRILEKLDPANADIYATNYRVLESGYELNYEALDLRFGNGLSKEQCNEVLQILNMFESLHKSYLENKKSADIRIESISFAGFDGTTEADYLGYVTFLMHDEGRFPSLKRGNLDSGKPMLTVYRRMLWEWEKSREKRRPLAEDLRRIQSARNGLDGISEEVWRAFAPRGFPPPVSLRTNVDAPPSRLQNGAFEDDQSEEGEARP